MFIMDFQRKKPFFRGSHRSVFFYSAKNELLCLYRFENKI